ncbi:MAG: SPOR domain-containing protein [Alphaproteobacteria bacterium]|nr:SPOR domain-containing protein [Alphaproteobacteria bacterium]
MNRQQPPELYVYERPVRSDTSQERAYARRRLMTVIVLAAVLGGGFYALWGRGPSNPADIPTIKAAGAYRQKPAEPGGIDIPNQNVLVYDQMENKNDSAPQVEHLLPPPEEPKETAPVPDSAQATPALPTGTAVAAAPAPAAAPVAAVTVASKPASAPSGDVLGGAVATKPVETTVAAAPVPSPVPPQASPVGTALPAAPSASQTPSVPAAPPQPPHVAEVSKPQVAPKAPVSIAQLIETTKAPTATDSGDALIQLASLPDEAQARATMENLQKKYAAILKGVTLRLARADLGKRGIYYRIQSKGMPASDASRLCASLKQINAGCILVRK